MDRKDERRRRLAAVRALAAQGAVTTRDGRPSPALREALSVFGGERELLLAAHQRWQVHLLARLDQLLELGPPDPHDVVRQAVDELSAAMPGLAALLAEHADDPVLARAQERLVGYVDQACPCGRRHAVVTRPRGRRTGLRRCPLAAMARAGGHRVGVAIRTRTRGCGHRRTALRAPVARLALPRP